MQLNQLSGRIYYSPYEQRRDRPNLGYIRGETFSVMVDAGASAEHTDAFYRAVARAGLPVPEHTVITHWHWDHCLGMCAVKGRTIAHRNTQPKLIEMRDSADVLSYGDERMCLEYPDVGDIVIALPDILFESSLVLSMGGIHCHITRISSPHSDDSTAIRIPEEGLLRASQRVKKASQSSRAKRGKKIKSFFAVACTSRKILCTQGVCPQGAREECRPKGGTRT